MSVNVSKTKYIIFRTKGKKIDVNVEKVVFNNNEIGQPNDHSNILIGFLYLEGSLIKMYPTTKKITFKQLEEE